ncbi:MAG: hypothetical protein ACLPX9_13980 [Rhodomicrobium sp.]
MKHTFAAVAISLATAAMANVANAANTYVWQGDSFATSNTAACSAADVAPGNLAQTIFAPGGLTGNATNDEISRKYPQCPMLYEYY